MTKNTNQPSSTRQQFVLRFDSEGQRDSLKARATANKRTMNGEILFLIEAGIRAIDAAQAESKST